MNYVTTNIRFYEDDYLRLKDEAARKRISLSEVVRQRVRETNDKPSSGAGEKLLRNIRESALVIGKNKRKGNIVETLRNMRYGGKW